MRIADASAAGLEDVLFVEREAFGEDAEADLVLDLIDDPSARPLLSLLAWEGERAVGHILFTAARLEGAPRDVSVAILAPLAVVPGAQRQGVGGSLIEHGKRLAEAALRRYSRATAQRLRRTDRSRRLHAPIIAKRVGWHSSVSRAALSTRP